MMDAAYRRAMLDATRLLAMGEVGGAWKALDVLNAALAAAPAPSEPDPVKTHEEQAREIVKDYIGYPVYPDSSHELASDIAKALDSAYRAGLERGAVVCERREEYVKHTSHADGLGMGFIAMERELRGCADRIRALAQPAPSEPEPVYGGPFQILYRCEECPDENCCHPPEKLRVGDGGLWCRDCWEEDHEQPWSGLPVIVPFKGYGATPAPQPERFVSGSHVFKHYGLKCPGCGANRGESYEYGSWQSVCDHPWHDAGGEESDE